MYKEIGTQSKRKEILQACLITSEYLQHSIINIGLLFTAPNLYSSSLNYSLASACEHINFNMILTKDLNLYYYSKIIHINMNQLLIKYFESSKHVHIPR